MRLNGRTVRLIFAAASIGVVTACTSTASAYGPRGTPTRATTSQAPRARASASPSPDRLPAGLVIRVTGAPRKVKAKGAVLANAATGQVLWSRNPGTERPIASVTKAMTALLVLQGGQLDRQIRVPKAAQSYAWKNGGESAGLHPGDVLTAQELLAALLLPSGADAAYTLANAYGPGLRTFLARMNSTAAALGMKHTHFTSPDGLPYPTETSTYSTPSDLLTLGLAVTKYPAFRSIVKQPFYRLAKGRGHHQYWWDNTNHMIGTYQGALGIKDGYTNRAGHCLLFEAYRNGRTLIGVVLASPARGFRAGTRDAESMLNWGFGLPQTG